MFFDVLIIIIIVVCAVFGFRNGFLISLSRIGGWIGAIIVALLFRNRFSEWLLENTELYSKTQVKVENVCRAFVDNYIGAGDPSGGAGGFSATLENLGEKLALAAAEQIMTHLWTVIVFVIIVFGIKIILFVATLLLSKKFHAGMLGGIDGVAGLLFGLFQAVAAILVVFALILPLSYTVSAQTHDDINRSMNDSIVAKLIYENNPLLDFIDGFLPTGLTPEKWLTEENYQHILNNIDNPRPHQNNSDDIMSLFRGDDSSSETASESEASTE